MMLCRIGFRYLLPPVQLVLYCVLCFSAHWDRQGQQPCTFIWSSSGSFVFAQDGGTVTIVPCRTPKAELVAGSLNLPAQMAATILAAILATALHREGGLWSFATSALLVVLLWYWGGLWIDRRLGYVGLRQGHSRLSHFLAKVAHGFSIPIVFLSVIMLLRAPFSQGHRVEGYVVASSFVSWSVFLLVVTSSNLRRPRPPVFSGMRG